MIAFVPLPNKIPPSVKHDAPVPPFSTARSAPSQLLLLILDAVDSEPNPKLVRASEALAAPVPPPATATLPHCGKPLDTTNVSPLQPTVKTVDASGPVP